MGISVKRKVAKTNYEIGKERWDRLVKAIEKYEITDRKQLAYAIGFSHEDLNKGIAWINRRLSEGNIKETVITPMYGEQKISFEIVKSPDYDQLAFKNSKRNKAQDTDKNEPIILTPKPEPTTSLIVKGETFTLEVAETTQEVVKVVVEKLL